jgi:hypothetical protein
MANRKNAGANEQADFKDLRDAVLDLTRVTLAVSGKFPSKSEAIRRLSELSIPPSRIAAILAVPLPNVTSAMAKARRTEKGKVDETNPSSQPSGD